MNSITPTNTDEYVAGFPENVQEILQKIRAIVRAAAPDAQEVLKYRIPTFVLRENLIHFAAFENHIGFYPTPSAIEAFRQELTEFKVSKGSVQFPLGRSIPFELLEKIVRFRVKEIREREATKSREKPVSRRQETDYYRPNQTVDGVRS